MLAEGDTMTHFGLRSALFSGSTLVIAASLALSGCRGHDHPDDRMAVYNALNQHDLRSVTVSQDRHAGTITLSGIVGSNDNKQRAEQIAKLAAPDYSIVDRLQVETAGLQSEIKSATANAQLDSAIEDHFRARLASHKALKGRNIKCYASNGTLTLKGTVKSYQERKQAEELARKVPEVQKVVNELEIKKGKPSPANASGL